ETRTIYVGEMGEDGEIDQSVARNTIKGLHILQTISPDKEINVILNSFGGCWFSGMGIYDAIKACTCHVTATVFGSAMSMGSVILQAADTRRIHPNGTLMTHDGYETRVDDIPRTFQNWARYSKITQRRMYEIYASRSGRTANFWKKKCESD